MKHLVGPDFREKKYLIACSGGVDSMTLAHLFSSALLDFSLAHVNYNLRGDESIGDMELVVNTAKKYQVPSHIHEVNLKSRDLTGKGLQDEARKVRYAFFEELVINNGYQIIATAHHAGDNLETMIINMLRGSGIKGISGVAPRRGIIIRPLLDFDKYFLKHYAEENGVEWREDSSNEMQEYLRNKIRHQVLPALENIVPQVYARSADTLDKLQGARAVYEAFLAQATKDVVLPAESPVVLSIDRLKLMACPDPVGLLFELIHQFGFSPSEMKKMVNGNVGMKVAHKNHIFRIGNYRFDVLKSNG